MCPFTGCKQKLRKTVYSNGQTVFQRSTNEIHNCGLTPEQIKKNEIKKEITLAYNSGIKKPSQIKKLLDERGLSVDIMDIYNRIYALKQADPTEKPEFYFNDIKERVSELKKEHKDYIVVNEEDSFILITSKEQLGKIVCARNYHIDATYKVMDPDYPLIVFGCFDASKNFQPIFLALVYEETVEALSLVFEEFLNFCSKENVNLNMSTLTADMAPQFSKLFSLKMPFTKLIQCWFHVKNAIEDDLAEVTGFKAEILQDLVFLHYSYSKEIFDRLYMLLKKKYVNIKKCRVFFEKFEKLRIKKNMNWYTGVQYMHLLPIMH